MASCPATAAATPARSAHGSCRYRPTQTAQRAPAGRTPRPGRLPADGMVSSGAALNRPFQGVPFRIVTRPTTRREDRMSDTDKRDEERRAKLVKAGVAVGIGSAAIVAALLYASTVRKKPKRTPPLVDPTD